MDYMELAKALIDLDLSGTPCPCEHEDMCQGKDCIITQATDAIEELTAELEYTKRQYDLAVEDLEKIGWGEWIPVAEEQDGKV